MVALSESYDHYAERHNTTKIRQDYRVSIDPAMREVCRIFNEEFGLHTFASCEGHPEENPLGTYVAMSRISREDASDLISYLRELDYKPKAFSHNVPYIVYIKKWGMERYTSIDMDTYQLDKFSEYCHRYIVYDAPVKSRNGKLSIHSNSMYSDNMSQNEWDNIRDQEWTDIIEELRSWRNRTC